MRDAVIVSGPAPSVGGAGRVLPSASTGPRTSPAATRARDLAEKANGPSFLAGMRSYTVTVATGGQWFAGTDDYVYVTLVGSEGCSERSLLDKALYNDFERGAQVDSYEVRVEEDLGEILLVKIEKNKYWVQDDWYCRYITVKTPSGDHMEFPCFRWIVDNKEVVLRDGRAHLPQDDKLSLFKKHRKAELEMRQKTYRWTEWQPGFPLSIDAKAHHDLPRDVQFDSEKGVDFALNYTKAIENLFVNQFMHMFQSSWGDFEDFQKIFQRIKNTNSEYVMKHWREDFLFGYQFLNGCNPVLIRKCTKIPDKFPVTHEMVALSLERELTLEQEVQAGNIFIVDYEVLEGVSPNCTDLSTTQYLAAPICLLYRNLRKKILPIAIQLGQSPGEDMPIFLPTDSHHDWLLAKIWVRSADFQYHQNITHLLRTHLITELFAIAMYRQLPAVHPAFKLLIPHVRFTIAINTKAREELICERGLFDKANATGGGGHIQLIQRTMKTLTFRSLCFPDMIKSRNMEDQEELPKYFYRDDGYKVWEATKNFVSDVMCLYYTSDEKVQQDEEIQAFVKDVCSFGMQDFDQCEFPKSLKSREELIEYLTIIIFTASAQHAAVNFGQYDWCSWIPNAPSTMRQPPPTQKGVADMRLIVDSLPDRGRSCWHLGAVWALSQYQENEIFLGTYPDEHFTEKSVKEAMEKFRKQLVDITSDIKKRNEGMKMPYFNMSPDRIPNSVAV
ncbi:polyunsaturated fatty acid 5-lipoxygenase isoform X1 [Synchiropus splendidus]|uniref:polyunsaturated fatty acid 5-lipoxygenase isoform X1 n=1 Tax=Synchiropus splendidus TaxID=270530 RepID=UPI00237E1E0A|nr:polyunsaturated fatty acid 5-lipoxygenase isoform X1 [Synchiropus splendidus]